jgi:hypothetical protein
LTEPRLTSTETLVCKAWQEQVEFLAKTEWIRDTTFNYPGEMIVSFIFHSLAYLLIPGHAQWHPERGKVYLDGNFTFQRLEGELAIFQITDCAPEFVEQLVEVCQATLVPDVEVGEIVHDVEVGLSLSTTLPELYRPTQIKQMSVEWDTLTLTCPWRIVIASVLAEELRVVAYRRRAHKEMMTTTKRLRHKAGGDLGLDDLMKMMRSYQERFLAAYVEVRKARRGGSDKRGDERLKIARQVASMHELDD